MICIEQKIINSVIRASVSVRLIINFCIIICVDGVLLENNKKFSNFLEKCTNCSSKRQQGMIAKFLFAVLLWNFLGIFGYSILWPKFGYGKVFRSCYLKINSKFAIWWAGINFS